MQHNGYGRHVDRQDGLFYSQVDRKGVITIGSSKSVLIDYINTMTASADVEVIGLLINAAHDSYEIYVKLPQQENVEEPMSLLCDNVAKTVEIDSQGRMRLMSVQTLIADKAKYHH